MNKLFLPISICLLAVSLIFVSIHSSPLINGLNKEKQEVKAVSVSSSPTPSPTITPSPTLSINRTQYIEPTDTPTSIPTQQPAYSNFKDKEAYCKNIALQVVQMAMNDPETKKDMQLIQGEVGSGVTNAVYNSAYNNAFQLCLSKMPQ